MYATHHFLPPKEAWNVDVSLVVLTRIVFLVCRLQELSGGHALWYTGTLTMYHYNFVGVFNVNPAVREQREK